MHELVFTRKSEVLCTSLNIAKNFEKQHKTVLRSIEKIMEQNCATKSMYHLTHYENRGKNYPMYLMNRDGFSLLVMSFTGKKALDWKLKYINAFNKMEKFIYERNTLEWKESRKLGKITRKKETETIKKLVEIAKLQGSKHANKLYMIYTNLANKIGGISNRDEATTTQLQTLSLIENIILNEIEIGMLNNKHYKDIYEDCKQRLMLFKEIAYLESYSDNKTYFNRGGLNG